MLPNHSFTVRAVTANFCVKVTKDDELISIGNSGDDSIQVFIKLVFDLILVGHGGGGIDTDNDGELLPCKGRSLVVIRQLFTPFCDPANAD